MPAKEARGIWIIGLLKSGHSAWPGMEGWLPKVKPSLVQDVNTGIAWVLNKMELYGGCIENVTLVGQSAGAQLGLIALMSQVSDSEHEDDWLLFVGWLWAAFAVCKSCS